MRALHRDEILEKIRDLPGMPAAAVRAAQLATAPEPDVNELVRCIEFDPGLTANLLRIANSAFFAGGRRVRTVREATLRLGVRQIQDLAIGVAISPMTHRKVKGYDTTTGTLFTHSVAVAIGAEEFARHAGREAPTYTFTAALLHDLGKVALAACLPMHADAISNYALSKSLSFVEAERAVLGIDHAEAGALLLAHWKMPAEMVEITRWHHEPSSSPAAADNEALLLVHLANHFCVLNGLGGDAGRAFLFKPDDAVTATLSQANRDALVARIAKRLEEWKALMK